MIARLPAGVVVLVALASAVSVAVAALPVVSRFSAADQAFKAATRITPQAEPAAQRADLSAIFDFAPFGRAAQPVTTDATQADTPLSVTLQGVSVSPNPAASRAIIARDDGQTASFAIGDAVAPGQILTSIAADHVLLDLDGQSQRLDFPTQALAVAITNQPLAGGTDLQNLIPVAQPAPVSLTATIKAVRDALQRNPQAVLDRYGITATGKGYLVGANTPPALLQTGLQPGDLITGLNGRTVGTLAQDRSFLDEVAATGQAEITVLRLGETVSLSVPLQ